MEYLVSKGIPQINVSWDIIYTNNNGDLKIGDLIINNFRKTYKHANAESSKTDNESSNTEIMILHFGKTVVNMLFNQSSIYRAIIKLLHKHSWEDFIYK